MCKPKQLAKALPQVTWELFLLYYCLENFLDSSSVLSMWGDCTAFSTYNTISDTHIVYFICKE